MQDTFFFIIQNIKHMLSKEKVEQIRKLFSRMDPNGNGYVEQPEFEKYLEIYGISIDKERCGYLFSLIQSHNAEHEDGGTSHNGKIWLPLSDFIKSISLGITLEDMLLYFEQEHVEDGDEDEVDHVGLLDVAQYSVASEEDQAQVAALHLNDNVFKATMFQLLRQQAVTEVDLQKVADTRWKDFANFERKVDNETLLKGKNGIVGDILPGR